jgi:predicted dehydrogenase
MKYKKILFIGLGGAGQRHLRILYDLLPKSTDFFAFRSKSTTPLLNADFTVNSKSTLKKEYNLTELDSVESAFSIKPDLTVISTPSSLHVEYMMKAVENGSAVFVEKPWSNNLNNFTEFRDLIINKNTAFNISFQRRYDSKISKVNKLIKNGKIGKPISASFNVFSNVPFWHPYEDWKKLYAVNAEMGGGVLLTEIHEIDLVSWFFGIPDKVFCSGGNRSEEKLDVEDTVQITLMYKDFSVQITLCFMHKKQSRNFHITGSSGDITWDGSTNKLTFSSFDDKNNSFTDNDPTTNDDMFYNQARKFINDWSLDDTKLSLNSASSSLAIIEAAKKSIISNQIEKISLKNIII